MTLGGWIEIGYAVMAALTLRPVAGAIAWHGKPDYSDRPSMDDWMAAYIVGGLTAAAWPLIALCCLASWVGSPLMFRYEREQVRGLREREQAERIRQLERELNL